MNTLSLISSEDDSPFGRPVSDRYREAGVDTLRAKTARPYNDRCCRNRNIDDGVFWRRRDSVCWKK